MSSLDDLTNEDETCWLLTATHYAGETNLAFAWNEWERLTLESAGRDLVWATQIRRFWDAHMPIALTVDDGYGYYALLENGKVVVGREPEFEDTSSFANSYEEFLEKLSNF